MPMNLESPIIIASRLDMGGAYTRVQDQRNFKIE